MQPTLISINPNSTSSGGRDAEQPPSLLEAAAGSSSFPGSGTLKLQALSKRGSFKQKPSLEEARRFEERRKPHRIPDASQPSGYRLARVGESEDELTGAKAEAYTMATPLSGLDTFGIGISLYFRQVCVWASDPISPKIMSVHLQIKHIHPTHSFFSSRASFSCAVS